MKHEDIAGNEIKVGDYIVYAALWSRSATLKYGLVTGLNERESPWNWSDKRKKTPTVAAISVDRFFDEPWKLQNSGRPVTLGFLDRLLVVPRKLVPPAAFNVLAKAWLTIAK